MDPVYQVARHLALFKADDLPESTLRSTKRFILDNAAAAIAGSTGTGCREVMEQVTHWGGRPESTIYVFGAKLPAYHAAFVNGMFSHARELDDGHEDGSIHTYSSVLPAALAVAEEQRPIPGRKFLTAVALGVDLNARLALSMRYHRGWHFTGICGSFGAAAAVGRLLGLDEEKMRHALGIAYCETAGVGIGSSEGTITKRMNPGLAARTGIMAAYFAMRGVTGPRTTFEGKEGFFTLFDGDWHDEQAFRYKMDGSAYTRKSLTDGLGERFEGENLYMKFFPACRFTQAPIQATLEAVRTADIRPEDVKRVKVFVCKRSMKYAKPFDPGESPEISAQFSIRYVVAAAILRKRVFLEAMEREAVLDDRVLDLTKKIEVINDPAIKLKVPVTVEIETNRGELIRGRAEQIKGNPAYPLTDDELWEKFLNCAGYSARPFSREELETLADTIARLEALPDAGILAERMVPK